jgi:hypothetical protein
MIYHMWHVFFITFFRCRIRKHSLQPNAFFCWHVFDWRQIFSTQYKILSSLGVLFEYWKRNKSEFFDGKQYDRSARVKERQRWCWHLGRIKIKQQEHKYKCTDWSFETLITTSRDLRYCKKSVPSRTAYHSDRFYTVPYCTAQKMFHTVAYQYRRGFMVYRLAKYRQNFSSCSKL